MERREFLKKCGLILASGVLFRNFPFFNEKGMPYKAKVNLDDELELLKNIIDDFNKTEFPENFGDLIIEVGKKFLGYEYQAGTLDIYDDKEELIIKVSGFDCVTFVENVLTFSRLIKKNKLTVDNFLEELKFIRYRDGVINGYSSRLHYFSDWIYNNSEKGVVKDLGKEIGGSIYDKKINFMSQNPSSYKQLNKNKELIDEIKQVENDINQRKKYYIKLEEIDNFYDKFSNGDIFALTTNIKGLDVSHTGFILIDNGVRILHASLKYKKVVISEGGIKDYMQSIKKCSGLMLARPII